MQDKHDGQPEMLAFEERFVRIVTELLKHSNDILFKSERRAACMLTERPHDGMSAPEVTCLEITKGHPLYGAYSDWSQCLVIDLPKYAQRIKGAKPTDLLGIRDQKAIEDRAAAIFQVAENFNSRRDLLEGINIEVSPGLATLEKVRYGVMENSPEAKTEQQSQNTSSTKKRGEITQKVAAKLCGVSESTIYNWERGERCPSRYPGRSSALAFKMWAEAYNSEKRIRRLATGAERARPMDPKHLDEEEYKSAFDED